MGVCDLCRRKPSRIGLISDTHGLLRPEALAALRACDLIVHAGDIGSAEILDSLGALAPVVAVKGNIDKGDFASGLPLTAAVETPGGRLFVVHGHEKPPSDLAAGSRFVITGHSHRPSHTERAGILCLNPGSAGPRRFRFPVTLARMAFREGRAVVEFVDLLTGVVMPAAAWNRCARSGCRD